MFGDSAHAYLWKDGSFFQTPLDFMLEWFEKVELPPPSKSTDLTQKESVDQYLFDGWIMMLCDIEKKRILDVSFKLILDELEQYRVLLQIKRVI